MLRRSARGSSSRQSWPRSAEGPGRHRQIGSTPDDTEEENVPFRSSAIRRAAAELKSTRTAIGADACVYALAQLGTGGMPPASVKRRVSGPLSRGRESSPWACGRPMPLTRSHGGRARATPRPCRHGPRPPLRTAPREPDCRAGGRRDLEGRPSTSLRPRSPQIGQGERPSAHTPGRVEPSTISRNTLAIWVLKSRLPRGVASRRPRSARTLAGSGTRGSGQSSASSLIERRPGGLEPHRKTTRDFKKAVRHIVSTCEIASTLLG
jgi:hypothetical protein